MSELISEDEFLHRAVTVPIQALHWDLASRWGVDVLVRRDDLVDTSISGNKFYKLFYNLRQAKSLGYQTLLSFGGAYSNHIYALAAAGRDFGFNTVGVIRGERPRQLSPMLQDAERWGMQLHFVSRTDYRAKQSLELQALLRKRYGDFFAIPEGGANRWGVKGAEVIGWALEQQLAGDYTAACLACGTGNTLAGVAAGIARATVGEPARALGFSVLKGEGNLAASIICQQQALQCQFDNWRLISGYHGGGYGKKLPEAMHKFSGDFTREIGLPLDPVYTAKMCWGVAQLLAQGYWPRGSRLVLIHTGGLQGGRGR